MANFTQIISDSSYADKGAVPEDIENLTSIVKWLLCVTCVLAVVVNLKVFACIHWIRRPLNSVLKISLSLALADSCASCLSGGAIFCENLISRRTYIILDIIRMSFILVTVFHLLGLGFTHYIGIKKPLHHNSRLSQRGTSGLILLLWLVPTTFIIALYTLEGGVSFWQAMLRDPTPPNNTLVYYNFTLNFNLSHPELNDSFFNETNWYPTYLPSAEDSDDIDEESIKFISSFRFRMIFGSFVLLSMFLIVICYLWILIMIRHQRKVWKDLSRTGSTVWRGHKCRHVTKQKAHEQNKTKGNLRAVYTTLIILGSCVMGWMPALILYTLTCRQDCFVRGELLDKFNENYPRLILMIRFFDNEMLFLKMIVNPIIYSIRMREIKEGTKQMHNIILHHLCRGRCNRMHNDYSKSFKSTNGNHSHVVLTSLGSVKNDKCCSGRYRSRRQTGQTSHL
ncbi:uncharacterized protein LOC123322779 [Coccinella septempunctata]|uniref:uncharacterized protein LOC123322779 n=1 Tax=Coccinella septempunctata TaxID=41139 RepID=UPI001D07ED1E|nr:uncharacterized protein LOC123322779 [Coccinella septempunctata]